MDKPEYEVTLRIQAKAKYTITGFKRVDAEKEAIRLAMLDYDIDPDGAIEIKVIGVRRSDLVHGGSASRSR